VWALLRAARKAFKAWKSMDPQHRQAVAAEAQQVRALAVELGGPAAARFVDGSADAVGENEDPERAVRAQSTSARPKATVTAELKEAVEALSRACIAPGAKVFSDSAPRSVRLGGRMTRAGARHIVPRVQERMRTSAATDEVGLPSEKRAPGWYADPSGRFEHRYWDGHDWTSQVSRNGVFEIDATEPPTESTKPTVE
jgi:hypothetical protein